MSTVLITGCSGIPMKPESLRVLLERSGQSQPKLSLYDQGKRHLQFRQAGLAIQAFETMLKENPNSIEALNGLAIAYDRLGRGDVAQGYLDRALSLEPESPVTLNNLAYLNLVQGNTAVALAYAERAKMAAGLPMDMMLPETIASAVDRTAEIATQIANQENQERSVAQAPAMPQESDIKKVGVNEWQLRIRPPNPADAVRINLPARDAVPHVIEPMARSVVTLPAMAPLTDAVVVSDIPDSVLADLMPSPEDKIVASLPQTAMPETAPALVAVAELPPAANTAISTPGPVTSTPADAVVSPVSVLPDPVISMLVEAPSVYVEPVPAEPVIVSSPQAEPSAAEAIAAVPTMPEIPSQPLPEPIRNEPAVVALRIRESIPTFASPTPGAPSEMLPVVPALPLQESPDPTRDEFVVIAALPAPEPMSQSNLSTVEANDTAPPPAPPQTLPESTEALGAASLPAFEPVPEFNLSTVEANTAPSQNLAEPAPDADVVAALPTPEAAPAFNLSTVEASTIPSQNLPEPAPDADVVAALPTPEPLPAFGTSTVEASIAPPQNSSGPAPDAIVVAALPEPAPAFGGSTVEASVAPPQNSSGPAPDAIVVAALPEPALNAAPVEVSPVQPPVEEPTVATLSQPPVATSVLAPVIDPLLSAAPAPDSESLSATSPRPSADMSNLPEVARLKEVLASLSVPQPVVPVAPKPPVQEASVSVSTVPPAPVLIAPAMVASLAPSRPDAPSAVKSAGLKTDWRANVPASTDIRVSNGTGRHLMAGRFARYFGEHGLKVDKIRNANSFNYRRTVIFYNPDQRAHAEALASVLPFPVRLAEAKQGRGQIEVILGFDLLGLDDTLRST